MDEQEWAERLSRDAGKASREMGPLPAEYCQVLEIARTLAAADLSAESRVRHSLRQRLLEPDRPRLRTPLWRRYPALAVASLILVGLLAVALIWPQIPVAIGQAVRSLMVGPYTEVIQVDPTAAAIPPYTQGPRTPIGLGLATYLLQSEGAAIWVIDTPLGGFSGPVEPGQDLTVYHFDSVEEAQAHCSFRLREPAYLPAEYALYEVMVTPIRQVFLLYSGPRGLILLGEIPVGANGVPGIQVGGDTPFEEVALNGRPAAWLPGSGLVWEDDDVSYHLGGIGLNLDEAVPIAESVR